MIHFLLLGRDLSTIVFVFWLSYNSVDKHIMGIIYIYIYIYIYKDKKKKVHFSYIIDVSLIQN